MSKQFRIYAFGALWNGNVAATITDCKAVPASAKAHLGDFEFLDDYQISEITRETLTTGDTTERIERETTVRKWANADSAEKFDSTYFN